MKIFCAFLLMLLPALPAAAASDDDFFGLDDDETASAAENTSADKNTGIESSSFLNNRLPQSAVKNINSAEKVFCYTVDYAPADYSGYTIHGLALKGSCGELSDTGIKLMKDSVLNNNALYSSSKDDCNIVPKIILRYINGADYTDVLFSSPCQSLTFFHDADIVTVNAAPGAAVTDLIVKTYSGLAEPYKSPALLGQMVANGQVMNKRDTEVLRRMAPQPAPVKKWSTPQQPAAAAPQNTNKAKTGWNRLR